jgi:Tol biopolymer transport system component
MRFGRRALLLIAGVTAVVVVAAAGIVLAARGGDEGRKYAGRIGAVDGCGLLHMFANGDNQKELCLPGIWAAVSVSDNGEKLAWDTATSTQPGITVADLDIKFTEVRTEHQLPVPPGANAAPTLSPDGSTVAFLHSPADDGRYDIWTTPSSTTTERAEQVTANRTVSAAAWSPSGDWIAYVRGWSADTLEGDIVLVRPNGDDEHRVGRGDEPSWSPDSKRLAFTRGEDVWTMGSDGSDPRLLVRNGHTPVWSRDGELIAFARELKCGRPVCRERVFVQFASGGEADPVSPSFANLQQLLWLPDPTE